MLIAPGELMCALSMHQLPKLPNFRYRNGYKSHDCARMISKIPLPDSDILEECSNISEEDGETIYRRLLPAAYKDGLYKV